jgi:hypothetical protein
LPRTILLRSKDTMTTATATSNNVIPLHELGML